MKSNWNIYCGAYHFSFRQGWNEMELLQITDNKIELGNYH